MNYSYGSIDTTSQKYTDREPAFRGGEDSLVDFIQKNTIYPVEAMENDINGLVRISFVVNVDGKLSDIKVFTPTHELLNEEAIRVVQKTESFWTPAIQDGKLKAVKIEVPIRFSVDEEDYIPEDPTIFIESRLEYHTKNILIALLILFLSYLLIKIWKGRSFN